jgi:hypothetical protein
MGDSQSRAQASTKYTKVPNSYTHKNDMLAFMGNLRILLCPLWLYRHFASWAICLLGYSASWACLLGYFASLACLLGYFASWACLLGYLPLRLYINTLPLGLCLIDIVYFDNAGILLCLLGCANTGHSLVCQMISYVNMPNQDTLWDRIW